MNTQMKKTLIIFLVLLLSSINTLFAQKPDGGRDEIHRRKMEFIKAKLQLTAEEEKNFMPVYTEFETKRESIMKGRHEIFRKFNQNSLNLSQEEIQKMTSDLVGYSMQEAKIMEEYDAKFKTVLSPMKVMMLYISEHEFKKNLIKNMNDTN
jgi:hypothetical protein